MSDDKIDTKLKEDVKNIFEEHSKNIQTVQDVLIEGKKKLNLKIVCNQDEDVYRKLLKSKKAAQIALNLYNANEIYKDLKILEESDLENPCKNKSSNNSCSEEPDDTNKSDLENPRKKKSSITSCSEEPRPDSKNSSDEASNDDHEHVGKSKSSLKNPCKDKSCNNSCSEEPRVTNESYSNNSHDEEPCDDHDHVGKSKPILPNSDHDDPIGESFSVDKPDKSEVIDKLYRYVFYFLIAKNLEIIKIYKTIFGKERSEDFKCPLCETNISSTDSECSICGESLVTIYEKEIDKYEQSKIGEIKINKNLATNSVANKDVINNDDNKLDKDKSGSQLAGNDKLGEVNLDGNKWKCKHCGVVNEDGNVNCTVCMEARAEWNCRKCTFANEISSDKCEICGELRDNKADNNDDDREKDGRTESWICWYVKCEERNDGNELYCKNCGLNKSANRERGATVDMIRFGKIDQVWICYKCDNINYELNRSDCGKCFESKIDGSINKDNNNDDREKDEIIESWICWYVKCEERNDGNKLYCKNCGLDKSANRERGAAVEMNINGKIDQVWICYECNKINYALYSKICYACGVSKFDIKDESNNKDKDKLIGQYVVIASDNKDNDKWKCSKCQCGNDRESLSCKQCQSPIIDIWSCKKCSMRNQILDDYCVVCGEENENKIVKYCSKCKHGEIICDDLCGDCLTARGETWTCLYRLCENRNDGNVRYCKDCGLDRYADKINIGAPMWRCKGDVRDQIWICDKCFNINDISRSYCPNYPCRGRNNYRKWCRNYKCWYKYNYEFSKHCEMCNGKLD